MFGQPGNGELLLGRGGFEGSVGNSFGNETGSGSNAGSTSAPGQSGSSTFDLSDFPILGGENNSFGNALQQQQQQQQLMAQQQMMQRQQETNNGSNRTGQAAAATGGAAGAANLYRLAMGTSMANTLVGTTGTAAANFSMAKEDFPALPGAPLGGGAGNTGSGLLNGVEGGHQAVSTSSGISFGTSAPSVTRNTSNLSGVFGGDLDGLTNQFDTSSLLSSGSLNVGNVGSQQNSSNPGVSQQRRPSIGTLSAVGAPAASGGTAPGAGPSGGSALTGDFGLLGLLKVIRMTDADRNALALGSDLTSLGLNLNSSDSLYSTFASPWSENPTNKEPQYQLPMCYYMQPPALKTGHLSKFLDETLFYIFYALPQDVLQAYAAQELYSREWKFHVELKLWFKRVSPSDGSGIQSFFFDINSWECRLFNGNMNRDITSGLLPEDDIRVKFSSS